MPNEKFSWLEKNCGRNGFLLNKKAFALTIEAILALLIVASIASFPMQAQKTDLLELLVLQKENDLLKIWLQEELDEKEMASDFEFAFPQQNGTIEFNGKTIEIKKFGYETNRSVSSSALFYLANGNLAELMITVHC